MLPQRATITIGNSSQLEGSAIPDVHVDQLEFGRDALAVVPGIGGWGTRRAD
jgi:hypothetical protein